MIIDDHNIELNLPFDFYSKPGLKHEMSLISKPLPSELMQKIYQSGWSNDTAILFLCIYIILLHKISNQDTISFGLKTVDKIIPVENYLVPGMGLGDLIKSTIIKLERICLDNSGITVLTGDSTNDKMIPSSSICCCNQKALTKTLSSASIPLCDLALHVPDTPDNLWTLDFYYNSCRFKHETVLRFCTYYINILKTFAEVPELKIDDIDMISPEEKEQILHRFNDTDACYPDKRTVVQLFEEQAAKNPHNCAVLYPVMTGQNNDHKMITYQNLNIKANRLAKTLRQRGVRPGFIVGIMLERSLDMVVGILAILKAGGAYLPIEPKYPQARINYMLEDSGAGIVLTQHSFDALLEPGPLIVDINDETSYIGEGENLDKNINNSDLAYVIYTSGTTGNPKGVMVEHGSLINRLNWMQKKYPLSEDDVILQKTAFTFDVSLWELLWWAICGAKLCLLMADKEKDPRVIVRTIEKTGVSIIHFVPSVLNIFLEYLKLKNNIAPVKSLKYVFSSGEALSLKLVTEFNEILYEGNNTKLINLYGPTEATIDVTYFNCSPHTAGELVPIGKPIDNIRIFILDGNLKLQPIGVPGELYITGEGLARGYLNRAELNNEKFIINPFHTELTESRRMRKIYKTGDIARWLPDGNLEFLGRSDFQVKIRGLRIELGEIEHYLLSYPEIKECVVLAVADSLGNQYLSAFIVSRNEVDKQCLKLYLAKNLPDYMIPHHYIFLGSLPLKNTGKVDRKKLRDMIVLA